MTLRIISLSKNSVLAQQGAKEGDYIQEVNGRKISSRDELRLVYTSSAVEFDIRRGTKPFTIQVTADEIGATVEDSEGEIFTLRPQSSLSKPTPKPQSDTTRSPGTSYSARQATPKSSEAEKIIMLVAWTFLILNVLGGLFLVVEFGSESVRVGPNTVETDWNIQLIAIIIISLLSSIFLVAFSAMLCHFKRHLASIDEKLTR